MHEPVVQTSDTAAERRRAPRGNLELLRELCRRAVKAGRGREAAAVYARFGIHDFDTLTPQQAQEVRAGFEVLLS